MLGLFLSLWLLYFIGRAFYRLAFDYNKNEWLFAILGIVSYYAGTFICGLILGAINAFTGSDFIHTQPKIVLTLIALPFGLVTAWLFFRILVSVWNRESMKKDGESLDSDLI